MLLVLLVLAQIPFIYRRYETGKLADKIAQLDAGRTNYADPNFKEYKGIIHAHTNLGGHSTGSFDELIAAANANDLDFVLMTEHYSETFDTAAQTLNGVYGKTLFVGGNEIDTSDGDRFLLIPGGGKAARVRMSGTTAFINAAHDSNQLALITYPEKFKSWDSQFDGIEVFSLHTAAKSMNWLTALGDLIWSYPSYPELTLAKNFQRPDANLAKFDEIAEQRKISLFAGTDAHSNIGFHMFGDDAGNKLINIKVDPYATIFRIARIHVLLPAVAEFTQGTLIEAIRNGHYFIAFDALGDASNFTFRVEPIRLPTEIMGSEGNIDPPARMRAVENEPDVAMDDPPTNRLIAIAPTQARFVLYKDGERLTEQSGSVELNVEVEKAGTYRVEVYRDDLGPPFDKIPWIISNPIYVR